LCVRTIGGQYEGSRQRRAQLRPVGARRWPKGRGRWRGRWFLTTATLQRQ
jgi:hypothetical protein